jgi:hypothetical protein
MYIDGSTDNLKSQVIVSGKSGEDLVKPFLFFSYLDGGNLHVHVFKYKQETLYVLLHAL